VGIVSQKTIGQFDTKKDVRECSQRNERLVICEKLVITIVIERKAREELRVSTCQARAHTAETGPYG
jgi:hypothetical protein